MVDAVVEDLRRRSAVAGLPFLLFHLARDQATTDQWDTAEATYTEALTLAREVGHSTDLTACSAGLAWLEARRGREALCRQHSEEALRLSSSAGTAFFQAWALSALAELELGLGRAEAARVHFSALDELLGTLGLLDVDLSPAPDLVETLLRPGREEEARTIAEDYAQQAALKGQPYALARAARALGLTSHEDAEEQFALALAQHDRMLDSYERARTQLALGSWLRRLRRRTDARVPLRAALETFERFGAVPWAEQAAVELRAAGESTLRRRDNPVPT